MVFFPKKKEIVKNCLFSVLVSNFVYLLRIFFYQISSINTTQNYAELIEPSKSIGPTIGLISISKVA